MRRLGKDTVHPFSWTTEISLLKPPSGLTETSTTISMVPPSQKIGTPGASGMIIEGETVRILKPDGTYAKEGELGEILVRAPSNALGYLNNEQA